MTYHLLISVSWTNDFLHLPFKIRKKIPNVHKTLEIDPYSGKGKSIKVSKSQNQYNNLYRYKLYGYRIFYAIGKNFVRLLTIRIRNEDTYKKLFFNQSDMSVEGDPSSSIPKIIPTTHWDGNYLAEKENIDQSQHQDEEYEDDSLCYDESFLTKLEIPENYWDKILSCKNEEDIIDADLPENIIDKILYWDQEPIERIIEEPVYDLPSTEDLEKLLKGTIKGFLLKLDPEQEKVAKKSLKGPTLVKGGPGTGKSLVALYRIRNLLTPDSQANLFDEHIPKILFITYTTTLVEHSKQLLFPLLGSLADNVKISSVDSVVRQIIIESGDVYNPAQINDQRDACNQAIHSLMKEQKEKTKDIMNMISKLKFEYIIDEFDWVIEGRNIQTLDDYLKQDRAGRGIPLNKINRVFLWQLHEKYIDVLKRLNKKTYNMLRQNALEILNERSDQLDFTYDSVVIDEAQDLPPIAIKFCIALCKAPQGIYLTADAGQSIYQKGFSWKRIDDELNIRGRTTILKYNYRSTKQIAACSTQLLNNSSQGDNETKDLLPVKQGPKPILLSYSSIEEHIIKLKTFIALSLETLKLKYDSVAVFVRTKKVAEQISHKLNDFGIPSEVVEKGNLNHDSIKIKVMTLHSAKGLEFPIVIIARVDKDQIPKIDGIIDSDEKEAKINIERNLLSVGITRSMRLLAVSYSIQNPSLFINEMDKSLWTIIAD